MASSIQYGEQGAPYVARNNEDDETPGRRKYLSKDGKGGGKKDLSARSYNSPPVVPADIWESSSRKNRFGGGPPPGYGAHFEEEGFWETPIFKVHPITQKKEAINGLFFRLWPRHVRVLQKMKLEGWPHVEIVAVAKELRKRQTEEFQREKSLVEQYLQNAQQEAMQEAASVAEPLPSPGETPGGLPPEAGGEMMPGGPPPGGLPPEGGEGMMPGGPPPGGEEMAPGGPGLEEMMAMSLSRSSGSSYQSQLENYRGKFFSRDGGPPNILVRARKIRDDARQRAESLSKRNEPGGLPFKVIIKGEAGHEPELSQKQLKIEEEKDWARKDPGILGGSVEDTDEV